MPRLKSFFTDWQLWLALLLAMFALWLAYQIRIPFALDIGGQTDRVLLSWVFDPVIDRATQTRYRWTTGGTELDLRAWGAHNPVELEFRAARAHPQDRIAALTIFVNDVEVAALPKQSRAWETYTLPITDSRALANDDLQIRFASDTYVPRDELPESNDARRLGILLDTVILRPLVENENGWRAVNGFTIAPLKFPPPGLTLTFLGGVFILYAGMVVFAMPRPLPLLAAAGFAIAVSAALVLARPYVTLFATDMLLILGAGLAAGAIARWGARKMFRWGGSVVPNFDVNVLALLFAFAFVVKMAMLLYPHTISFDLLYHIHRLEDVMRGLLFWSIPSGKNEFGGQAVPYLPSFYLFLAPLAQWVPLRLLMQLSGAVLDSLTIFVLYFWSKRYFDAPRAGLFAAWIYIVIPLTFVALSWGIYANLNGQFLTVLLSVALVETVDRLNTPRAFVVVTLLLTLTVLSHTSVLVTLVPLLGIWIAAMFFVRRPRENIPLLLSVGSACVIAFALYYSQFVDLIAAGALRITDASLQQGSFNVSGESLTLFQLLQPARTEFTAVPLYVYAAALFGGAQLARLTWRAPSQKRVAFALLLAAWIAAFFIMLGIRAQFGFSARYVNFVMPALALCAGTAFAWVWERGILGQIAAFGASAVLAAQGLYHWYVLVFFKYH
jgi:hypothetical protein